MIPSCRDPALTMLKSKGYNVVQLPKSDLRPTQMLARKGKTLQRIGELSTVFSPDPAAPLPTISPDNPGTNISGTQSADIDVGLGLKILGGLISSLGGSALGLSFGYSRARTVQFEFSETLESNCQPAQLDIFLAGATINPFARAVSDMLESDDIFVITSTIKASKINVVAKDQNKSSISVDVPVIQQAIGGNVDVKASGEGSVMVTYAGTVPLVFGFQAVRLIFDDGRYRTMKLVDAGAVSLESMALSHAEERQDFVFLSEDRMISGDL